MEPPRHVMRPDPDAPPLGRDDVVAVLWLVAWLLAAVVFIAVESLS